VILEVWRSLVVEGKTKVKNERIFSGGSIEFKAELQNRTGRHTGFVAEGG
jgi:hypothetical protein